MRIGDQLHFAPNITFSQLDLSGSKLPCQLKQRVDFFFLAPADILLKHEYVFASGVLLVSCIDFLAKIKYRNEEVGSRIKKWCSENLNQFEPNMSCIFYNDFRNGLVHEARIKNGGEFSLETESTVQQCGKSLRINPKLLHKEVSEAFENYIQKLKNINSLRLELIEWVKENFNYELNN